MKKLIGTALLASTICSNVYAQEEVEDMLDMSLEQLADIEITSVSKRSEKASEVAAAVYVITAEDIRRSGLASIPELLRSVPGLQVAQAGSHEWAITARGFNAQFANKLLVLIDGRTVYTPLFSGVFWDVQDTMLENIERIEVIRGPGGTIWGANAVNGVINIITKNSKDTEGGLARVTYGNQEKTSAFRYGGEVDESASYRGSVSYKNNNEFRLADGSGSNDDWNQWRASLRYDRELDAESDIMVQTGAYSGSEDAEVRLPSLTAPFTALTPDEYDVLGAHVLSQWTHKSGGNQYSLQGYYDLATRDTLAFSEHSHTVDIDFNHSLVSIGRNDWMWGLGYRLISTDVQGTPLVNFIPEKRTDNLFSAFIQDKISLIPDELSLTLGSKFEHNDYTGFEWQPSARLAWLIDEQNTWWASVTRAVRTPNKATHDLSLVATVVPLPGGGAGVIRQVGDDAVDSETVISYETGYRIQPTTDTSLDFSLFFNDYGTLLADARTTPSLVVDSFFGPHVSIPFIVNDNANGETFGAELAANWQATEHWLLTGSYSFIDMSLNGGSTFVSSEESTPQHQFNVGSRYSFDNGLEWDNYLYFVDNIGTTAAPIEKYWRFDSRLGWEVAPGWEVSLVGQNLLDDRHAEFTPFVYQSQIEVPRAFYGKVSWEF